MAKLVQSYRFTTANPYTDDRGTVRLLTARFVVPPDMTAAQAIGLTGAAGGVAVLPNDPRTPCPDPGVQGRKLTFVRQNGNSLSLTMGSRDTLIAQALAIRNAINAVTAANPVVCIKLDGEYFPNLVDELAPANKVVGVGINSSVPANGKQNYFFGTMAYSSDAVYGRDYFIPFKVATDGASGVAPTMFAAALNLGNVTGQNIGSCPGSDPRRSRRYIVQSIVQDIAGAGSVTQTAEIPVATHLPADIQAVGVNLATIGSTQCLGYKGENNDRFHRLLP